MNKFSEMEKHYQGKWDTAMIGDFYWLLQKQDTSSHKRKKIEKYH